MGQEARAATVDDILQIGDPRLRIRAEIVANPGAARADARRVEDALEDFRDAHGFGRGTAATQLGIEKRIIALRIPDWPGAIFNPEITWRSSESMTLWENCMSFPFMLVRVSRAASISVQFLDDEGNVHQREKLSAEISELLQHEIDHLDGVLAVDHAIDEHSIVSRKVFDSDREYFLGLVNYRQNNDQIAENA